MFGSKTAGIIEYILGEATLSTQITHIFDWLTPVFFVRLKLGMVFFRKSLELS